MSRIRTLSNRLSVLGYSGFEISHIINNAAGGKHWIDEKTYVDDDGEVHTVEEKPDGEEDEPAFDMSAYDAEALAKLDEIFGNVLELR